HTDGNVSKNSAVARSKRSFFRDDVSLSNLGAIVKQNVSLLTVLVDSKADKSGAVRIVLYGLDGERNIELVVSKINIAIKALVAASLVAGGNASAIVPAGASLESGNQRLLRLGRGQSLPEVDSGHVAARFGRWSVFLNHIFIST